MTSPCFDTSYNLYPNRQWQRFKNVCPDPYTEMQNKANILQYKGNIANFSKVQKYSLIARGLWSNRKKGWASQTDSVTNPNVGSYQRVGYSNTYTDGTFTTEPLTQCLPTPTPPNVIIPTPSGGGSGTNNPPVIPPSPKPPSGTPNPAMPAVVFPPNVIIPEVIASGGTLSCTIVENICTGQIYSSTSNNNCYSSDHSDVPGPVTILCYDPTFQTFIPRRRMQYNAGSEKWPQGANLVSYSTYKG
jgi:hypothetical protein